MTGRETVCCIAVNIILCPFLPFPPLTYSPVLTIRATTASRVGKVRQIIDKDNKELVSEYDLSVGLLPGLPFRVKGTVVTSADLNVVAPETWEMRVRGTKVNKSNAPFLDQYLDDSEIEVPVGDAYKAISGSIPTAILKTYYVDEGMRITRDVDDNFFVFTRA